MNTITPFLWFDGQAEEAMHFYVSVFKDGKVISTMPGPDGKVLGVTFELGGQRFSGINGGPQFKFTEAISWMVECKDQAEVDYFWEKLGEGGTYQACGWLKDKYGMSWQVTPTVLSKLLGDQDRVAAGRAMQAMLQMEKLDIQGLQDAFDGK